MTWTPSEDDIARAKRKMAERDRYLAEVCEDVKSRFKDACPLQRVYVLWQRDVDFRSYVFFTNTKDIEDCKRNGIVSAIEDAIYEELERYGKGKRGKIIVAFEWDSEENVNDNFDGDYLLRLR